MKKYYKISVVNILVYYTLSIISTVLSLISPYITGKFIDIFTGSKSIYDIKYYCLLFSIVSIFTIILSFFQNRLYIKIKFVLDYC